MKANGEGTGGGGGKGGGWLAALLLFLAGLILIGGFAYPLLKSRTQPAAADDVNDVILGRLDRIEERLTLLEQRQTRRR